MKKRQILSILLASAMVMSMTAYAMTERRDKTSENYQRSKADLATLPPQSI